MTYLPRLGNVDNNACLPWAYLLIDLSATCQHLIGLKLNDINWINKTLNIEINLKLPHFHSWFVNTSLPRQDIVTYVVA